MSHEEVKLSVDSHNAEYPVIGETTNGLGQYLIREHKLADEAAFARIRRDALSILRRCLPFNGKDDSRTGLVVGYVQSGKTMSMECVSSLARDNGCRIIVLLAGITTNLLAQNADRLTTDLRAASGRDAVWRIVNTDAMRDQERQTLESALSEWRDPTMPEEDQRTFLFLVLKNHAHLDRLYQLFKSVNLSGVPTLILDDEADQAGLNTSPGKDDPSATYRKIALLRSVIPHHTYLQYTATPQAPLLIALDDMLSPAFAELVEPGDGYTGGEAFFGNAAPRHLVKMIDADDHFKPGTPPEEPPDSLLEALRVFFVGSAIAALRGKPTPRSMLVHPSQRVNDHKEYMKWISNIVKRWAEVLRGQDQDDRHALLEEFRTAYNDLAITDTALPAFDDLVPKLGVSLRQVEITEVNSDGAEIDWKNAEVHIIVGGDKLNRGFTVEGLTVTYMPRDAGGWNADTLQQRARFFGYKQSYLGLCRLYLHPDVIDAFRSYVLHEVDVRGQLEQHRGRPLREWKRAFFLDAKLQPTRRNVLSDPYYRVSVDEPWFRQRTPHSDVVEIRQNRQLLESFIGKHAFGLDERYLQQKIGVCDSVSLSSFFNEVLLNYHVRGVDVPGWVAQRLMLREILESDEAAGVVVMVMRMGDVSRERKADSRDTIVLHQGRSSKADRYPGDAAVFEPSLVTVQIHWIKIKDRLLDNVPALAIHIPPALRKDDVLVQPKSIR